MAKTETEWITIQQAVVLTGLSDKTIRRYIKEDKIKYQYSKALRRYRIDKQSLLHYLEYNGDDQTQQAKTDILTRY